MPTILEADAHIEAQIAREKAKIAASSAINPRVLGLDAPLETYDALHQVLATTNVESSAMLGIEPPILIVDNGQKVPDHASAVTYYFEKDGKLTVPPTVFYHPDFIRQALVELNATDSEQASIAREAARFVTAHELHHAEEILRHRGRVTHSMNMAKSQHPDLLKRWVDTRSEFAADIFAVKRYARLRPIRSEQDRIDQAIGIKIGEATLDKMLVLRQSIVNGNFEQVQQMYKSA